MELKVRTHGNVLIIPYANINLSIDSMKDYRHIILKCLIPVLILTYILLYMWNPLGKIFNLGLIALIFSVILFLIDLLFRNKTFRIEMSWLITITAFIIIYFVI